MSEIIEVLSCKLDVLYFRVYLCISLSLSLSLHVLNTNIGASPLRIMHPNASI